MAKYLDLTGLQYLWTALKGKFVLKETGKGLSTNDYTSAEKSKLEGIAAGANAYTHPTPYTAKSSGLYKITTDSSGHVTAVAAVTKADITALGIPAQDTNTTYAVATSTTDGLMSKADKTKVDGLSEVVAITTAEIDTIIAS